jgi:hypothetical protein
MLLYSYPAAFMPFPTIMSAWARMSESVTLHRYPYQVFQPNGSLAAMPVPCAIERGQQIEGRIKTALKRKLQWLALRFILQLPSRY